MTTVKFDRIHGRVSVFGAEIPSEIIDILDELFIRYEWDINELTYTGYYDQDTNIFNISSVIADGKEFGDQELEYAYDCLSTYYQPYIAF